MIHFQNYSFSDRDMYMRYRGDGIGHRSTEISNEDLLKEIQAEIENILTASPEEIIEDEEQANEMESDLESEEGIEPQDEEENEQNLSEEEMVQQASEDESEKGDEQDGYAEL